MPTILKREKALTGNLLGLLDYDIVTYSAGHASDNKYYVTPDGQDFKYKREALNHCENIDVDPAEIESIVEPEPIEHCLFTVKQMVRNIAEAAGCNKFKGYLTGENNFRETIDSLYPYKGHRDGGTRPLWYNEIREYLVKNQNGIIVDGMEADDALSIEQCKDPDKTIICTKDKDLWMVPGWKYNFGKEPRKFYVKPLEGLRWFYTQLLTGDRTDNIMGCGYQVLKTYQSGAKVGQEYKTREGIGEEGAKNILSMCRTEKEMYEEVLSCYLDFDLDEYDLLENANLLWMLRKEGEYWQPPGKR